MAVPRRENNTFTDEEKMYSNSIFFLIASNIAGAM
jgi:hypothetical protein